jgi:hypothetical protein
MSECWRRGDAVLSAIRTPVSKLDHDGTRVQPASPAGGTWSTAPWSATALERNREPKRRDAHARARSASASPDDAVARPGFGGGPK